MSDLTTVENVKDWLTAKQGSFGTLSDTVLQQLVTRVSAVVQTVINRQILSATYSETYNGTNGQVMTLRQYPVTAVNAVTIDGIAILPRSASNAFGFVFDEVSVMVSGGAFWRGWQNVAITYVAGYPSVPYDLEQAVIDTIGDWFRYRDRIGMTSQAIEQQTTQFTDKDIPTRAKLIMNNYRRVWPT